MSEKQVSVSLFFVERACISVMANNFWPKGEAHVTEEWQVSLFHMPLEAPKDNQEQTGHLFVRKMSWL
jgi:hypothetical protein